MTTIDENSTNQETFQFDGGGAEYFKIWIVNILLSILTLGIYSAWAKVRRKRYFYGSTSLDGARFEYLADPKKILKGRIIVFFVYLTSQITAYYMPLLNWVWVVLFIAIAPWVIIRALKFNAVNSSYRNVRFNFNATYGQALKNVALPFLTIYLTLGLALPYFVFRLKKFVIEHTSFGTTPFKFHGSAGAFFKMYGLAFLGFIIWVAIVAGLTMPFDLAPLLPSLIILGTMILALNVQVIQTNYIFEHLALTDHRFRSTLGTLEMLGIYITNLLAMALSLGLMIPWAQVRLTNYRLRNLALVPTGSLAGFINNAETDSNAFGEEMSDFFDMDIGL